MSNLKNLKKLREGLVLLSRDRQVVYSFHETFEMVDEMLELVDQLIEKSLKIKIFGQTQIHCQ